MDDDLFQSLEKSMHDISTDELIGADSKILTVSIGLIKSMKIGKRTFIDKSVSFSDISHLQMAYKIEVDGLIGYPILSDQKSIISFNRAELIFLTEKE